MVSPQTRPPPHTWIGVTLVALCWPANWLLPGLRTHLLFFPLWLGYILTVDGLVCFRRGDSLLTRAPRDFSLLFLASIPGWWIFETLNRRLGNWGYLGAESLSDLEYYLLASLSFSTVVPAVLETAELLRTFDWTGRFDAGITLSDRLPARLAMMAIGGLMLGLLLTWPRIFYPLTWISLIFLFEPLCRALGRRCLLLDLARGDWRKPVALAFGALICGFFWELWNVYSYPKWIYHIPGLGFARVFEMPILGYLGYLPFGLELYALTHLILRRPPDLRL